MHSVKPIRKLYSLLETHPFLFILPTSALITLMLEMFSRRSVIEGLVYIFTDPLMFLANMLIVLLSLSVVILCRRRVFVLTLIFTVWFILGLANCIVLGMRVTPFSATDLMMAQHVLSITSHYVTPLAMIAIAVAAVAVIVLMVILWRRAPRVGIRLNYKKSAISVLAIVAISLGSLTLGVSAYVEDIETENIVDSYDRFGFAYCFSSSIFGLGIDRPEDYSENDLDILKQQLSVVTDTHTSEPNIIYLQLESFMDLNDVIGLSLPKDPTPVFTELQSKYPSGELIVPTVGAGTVNTEFEILAGMRVQDFGLAEYPYKTILLERPCESIAHALRTYGYSTTAIHNNVGSFYGRHRVFPNLGFELFIPIEYMEDPVYNQFDWAHDSMLTEQILKALDASDGSDFVFAISVQAHGSYPNDFEIDPGISGLWDDSYASKLSYYITQISQMDTFLKDLISELEKRDEETVLVIYGDHLPALDIPEEQLESQSMYVTDYVIWNNIGLDVPDRNLTSYQLSAHIGEVLGFDLGHIFNYHNLFFDSQDYLPNLELIEYDMLYGDGILYDGIESDHVEMSIGLDPIVITDVTYEDHNLYIHGEHFTPYSFVCVDGDRKSTTYVSSELIIVEDCRRPKSDDKITIEQVSRDRVPLTRTDPAYLD
ncbi:MAG: LTA synthase family protein [Clostridia bacterium]|nr:LTA synthase family protein [Clostridia bacterium]